jgi:ABC-type multidrug transport system permease subunit
MSIRVKGNLRVRAALYAIGYFVSIFALGIAINSIIPYLEPWMGWTVVFGVLFYMVYSLMLTTLQFDDSITKVTNTSEKDKE